MAFLSLAPEREFRRGEAIMDANVSRAAGFASRSSLAAGSGLFSREYLLPFVLVTALFLLWGIPNNLNDVLIRQFMKSFEITRFQSGLVQSAFYLGYFALSIPAALIMRRFEGADWQSMR
jgi:hypothetical protein